jgi:pimeloyl-ACP methyl ester carboxylesterase
MPFARSGNLRIHYEVIGEGPPLLLLHRWSAGGQSNFHAFGWVDHLRTNHRLILVDLPGHGRSGKPWRGSAYSLERMAAAAIAVLNAEAIQRCAILSYSTGSQVAALLLAEHRGRFSAAVLGGVGNDFHFRLGPPLRARRRAPPAAHRLVPAPQRQLLPLVALERPCRARLRLRRVINGTRDGFARSAAALAARISYGELAWVSGRNHATTIGDRRTKRLASAFLARHLTPDA